VDDLSLLIHNLCGHMSYVLVGSPMVDPFKKIIRQSLRVLCIVMLAL